MNNKIEKRIISKLDSAVWAEPRRDLGRQPVHVVYGGAHIFRADTPQKMGRLALRSVESNAPNFAEFARAIWLNGADSLPKDPESIQELEFRLADAPENAKENEREAWFAWTVFNKTIKKLETEPVEDYRVDFEDGYGFRTDDEEDGHCSSAASELAELAKSDGAIPASGFRIKSLLPETRQRSIRTLNLFLSNLMEKMEGELPPGFVVTLPKIKTPVETEVLDDLLRSFEKVNGLQDGAIKIEILVETPESIPILKEIVEASNGRCVSAHFGAFDYTSSLDIAAIHQHIRHDSCNFARDMMQVSLAPLGIRLSDSVTTEMPIPVHTDGSLSIEQIAENRFTVRDAWRKHFNNVTRSQINGFYQSWDLHPAQLPVRYAAVYAFFLESFEQQAKRLSGFLAKATQAMTTGNVFDDLASAQGLLNFFSRGVNCGAFVNDEVLENLGMSDEELAMASFSQIMKARFSRQAKRA